MQEIVITLLLAAHLLCVNVAAAGPLVCIWLEWKERRGDALAGRTAGYLGTLSLVTLLAGGLLGLAIAAVSWSEHYQALWLGPMSYKAAWGVGEYAFSLLIAGGYLLWRLAASERLRDLRIIVLLLSGTNLLYHFPFLFTVASDVFMEQDLPQTLKAAAFRREMIRPDVLARVVHVLLASIAVTGMTLMGYGLRLQRQKSSTEGQRVSRWGGYLALIPSLLQVPVGLWLIAVLPTSWQFRALGGDVPSVLMLGASVMLALFMLQDLAHVAFGDAQREQLIRIMISMVVIVVLMTGVLRRIRPPTNPSAGLITASTVADLRR